MILNNTIVCAMTICCLNLSLVLHAAKDASVFLAFLDFLWGSQKLKDGIEFVIRNVTETSFRWNGL
jgi:hypothetical protein